MILFVAFRNIIRNRKNSLIIFVLFFVINSLLILGNTVLEEIDSGLRKSYVENFTADILIKNISENDYSIFGDNTPAVGEYFSIPVLNSYNEAVSLLEKEERVKSIESIVSGKAVLDIYGRRLKTHLFGVDGKSYFRFFSSIEIKEGSYPGPGRHGLMITSSKAESIFSETGRYPKPGDSLVLTMYGNNGFRIREVPLTGIYSYSSGLDILDEIMISDPDTLSSLNLISASNEKSSRDDEIIPDNIDSLFEDFKENESLVKKSSEIENENGEVSVENVLSHISSESKINNAWAAYNTGWNFILVKLEKSSDEVKVIKKLNRIFSDNGMGLKAVGWRKASGFSAFTVLLLKIVYNGALLLVVISGTIAVLNTLYISVFERTNEIGTMRAFGASADFIKKMFLLESMIITFISGTVSVLSSFIILKIINSFKLEISGSLVNSLLGDRIFYIDFSFYVSLLCTVFLSAAVLLSSIFPLKKALGVSPADAMRS